MRISHRADYGVRAMVSLARLAPRSAPRPVTRQELIAADALPASFALTVMGDLRKRQLVRARRGSHGGWALARPADEITVGDVLRALEGPLASVRGVPSADLRADGEPDRFVEMWLEVSDAVHAVLDGITIAELAGERDADPDQLAAPAAVAASTSISRPLRTSYT